MSRRIIPILPPAATYAAEQRKQRWRLLTQIAFFVLFALTPVFDLLRYDLTRGHAYFLGMPWHLGINGFLAGATGTGEAALNITFRLFIPTLLIAVLILGVSWKWGRLYCGWLCPHFSVVETVNHWMSVATGKPSIWESRTLPQQLPSGIPRRRDRRAWFVVVPLVFVFAFVWAVVLLSYLMPPLEMYPRLLALALTTMEAIFVAAATAVFSLEFLFARHLFCRYACAVGMFQSFAWMGNRRALVVGVDRSRLAECADCLPDKGSACEAACPMRLKPRSIKRLMFACTQCAQCVDACAEVKREHARGGLLGWISDERAQQLEGGFKAPRGRIVPPDTMVRRG